MTGIAKKIGVKNALVWSFMQRGSQQGLKFLLTLIMVRLLTPEDYGLLGMVIIFGALSNKLVDAGFSSALVQKKDITDADCQTAFYTNLAFSLVIYAVLFFGAPYIAEFYSQPVLTSLVRFTGLGVITGALSAIQAILYTRNLDFKTPTRLSVVSMVVGGVTGIICAWRGLGVWSLAIQAFVTGTLKCAMFWALGNFRPKLVYSMDSLSKLFSFGSRVSFLSIVETAFLHLHEVVIGRMFAPAVLGLYGRGKSLMDFGMMNVVQPLNLVIYPAMSRVQDSARELAVLHLRSLKLLGFMITPTMVFLACSAPSLVEALLTAKWLGCVPYLRMMCLVGALVPLRKACTTALKATNNLNDAIRLQLMSRATSLAVLSMSYRFGIVAMIFGEALTLAVFSWVYFRKVAARTETTVLEQVKATCSCVIPAAAAAAAVLCMQPFIDTNPYVELFAFLAVGATVYLGICHLMGNESMAQAVSFAQDLLMKKRRRPGSQVA